MKYENKIICGDALEVLKTLDNESIDSCITSPPYYGLRDYGVEGQLGLERTYNEYITKLCVIFEEVKRVLKREGTIWVNIGDSYSTSHEQGTTDEKMGWKSGSIGGKNQKKHGRANGGDIQNKSLMQIPARFAIEMSRRGWILRNEIIWYKPSCMPASVTDRFTVDFEKIFFFVKTKNYWFDSEIVKEDAVDPESYSGRRKRYAPNMYFADKKNYARAGSIGENGIDLGVGKTYPKRNKRCVWTINPKPNPLAHFATYPEELIETPVKAGCPLGGIIIDPFMGSGTTGLVAKKLNRKYLGIELNPEYIKIAEDRLRQEILL